jgi:hypothetical protein
MAGFVGLERLFWSRNGGARVNSKRCIVYSAFVCPTMQMMTVEGHLSSLVILGASLIDRFAVFDILPTSSRFESCHVYILLIQR